MQNDVPNVKKNNQPTIGRIIRQSSAQMSWLEAWRCIPSNPGAKLGGRTMPFTWKDHPRSFITNR